MSSDATTGPMSESCRTGARPMRGAAAKTRTSVRYWVCLGTLMLGAVALQSLRAIGAEFVKEAVPLKRGLKAFDRAKLLPEYKLDDVPAAPLEADVLETLGTEEYVELRIHDRENPDGAASMAVVFITYYTGKPDQVPHVPDECFAAGGYDSVGSPYNIEVPVTGVGAPDDEVPVRVIQFQSQSAPMGIGLGPRRPSETLTVFYFFHCNNKYRTTRNGVRLALGSLWDRYAYYAKIEIKFADRAGIPAPLEASQAALGPLLRKLMPILLEDHLADWDTLTEGAGAAEKEEG